MNREPMAHREPTLLRDILNTILWVLIAAGLILVLGLDGIR